MVSSWFAHSAFTIIAACCGNGKRSLLSTAVNFGRRPRADAGPCPIEHRFGSIVREVDRNPSAGATE
jgi:hypothetical protein